MVRLLLAHIRRPSVLIPIVLPAGNAQHVFVYAAQDWVLGTPVRQDDGKQIVSFYLIVEEPAVRVNLFDLFAERVVKEGLRWPPGLVAGIQDLAEIVTT
jgi:hypothetical protein